jgi:hypothetical protein
VRVFEGWGEGRPKGNLMSEKRKRATPDELTQILALMRAAGTTGLTPLARRTGSEAGGKGPSPLSRLDGPGTRRVAVGGEGLHGTGGEGSQAEREGPKRVRLTVRPDREPTGHTVRLSDVAPESLRWLWPGRIPAGKITLLEGDPGLGKSTLLCELAARISRGEPLPGAGADAAPTAPRGVLLFSAEDDPFDTIRPRIDAAGGDPQRIVAFVAVPDGTDTGRPFTLPHDLPILDALIARVDAALVVFDPLVAFLSVSASSDQHVRHALGALKASAERSGAAIVAVRHLTKSPSANPLYRGLGSIGIIGAARSGLLLAPDPDDAERRILAVAKGNLARSAPSLAFRLQDVPGTSVARLVWDGESPSTASQLLHAQTDAAGAGAARRSVTEEARAWLREALAAGPRPAVELRQDAAAHGIGAKALYAARRAEGVTVAKERIPNGRWVWTLTPRAEDDGEVGASTSP